MRRLWPASRRSRPDCDPWVRRLRDTTSQAGHGCAVSSAATIVAAVFSSVTKAM
jgi:hypothetical protein